MRSIRPVSIALTGLIACFALLLPSDAQAKCTRWDLSQVPGGFDEWGASQSNGFTLGFVFQQNGTNLQGAAEYWANGHGNDRTGGTIQGRIEGSAFQFTVRWSNGAVGDYSGQINEDGTLQGATFDANGRAATWTVDTSQKATCLAEASPPGQPTPRSPSIDRHICVRTGGSWDIATGKCVRQQASNQPPANVCRVTQATDVYDDCRGHETGVVLAAGTQGVTRLKRCDGDENWHLVKWPAGQGWVYSGTPPDFVSLNCP